MHASLNKLLRSQHSIVTRQQALSAGLTSRQIDWVIRTGELVAVHRGVFRDPATPDTLEQRAMAAVLAAGHGALVSHRMALALHGMRNYRCDLSEITATQRVERPLLIAHRVNSMPPHVIVQRIPATSPARTLLDCSTMLSPALMTRFLETWLSTGVVKLAQIDAELVVHPKHGGAGPMRQLLERRSLGTAEPDSPPEAALGQLLIDHGLPTPELHHVVTLPNGLVYELDWSYPHLMVAFEMDGYGVHLRSFEAFSDDRFRRNELEIHGWQILNFTARMLRRPESVADQVRRAVQLRSVSRT